MEAFTVTGPAKNLIRFAKAARARDTFRVEVEVLTYVRPGFEQNAFLDALRAAEVPVHVIEEKRAMDPRGLAGFRDVVQSVSPDVLQTHNVKSHLFARLLTRRRPPWIAFCHGYTTPTLKQRAYDLADYVSLRSADRVVIVCRAFSPKMLARGVDDTRLRVLHNSIEVERVLGQSSERHARYQWDGHRSIVSIGRLSSEKGHDVFIQAIAALRLKSVHVNAVLVGDGPERARLEAQVERLGLCDRVNFAGHQTNPEPFLESADVFVLPSRSEGSPNALLEAMAARVPIVSTDVGGVPEIISHGEHALLVPPDSPGTLAAAIDDVLKDSLAAERRAAAAARRVLEDFSPPAYLERLCTLYRELLAGGSASTLRMATAAGVTMDRR
jgi:glycosyltransferase involved in cell wall biosynthesis